MRSPFPRKSKQRELCGLALASLLLASAFIATFRVSAEPGIWFDPDWQFRKKITINHSKVAAHLSDFPMLVNLTDADLAAKAQTDGDDIVFADEYGNKLNHEIEYFDSTPGDMVAWVSVPHTSSTNDTVIYMYYRNPSAPNQQNGPGTWDADYVLVQHLQETTGTHYDSTSYGNNGTAVGGLNQNAAGKINGADQFDGSDDYIQIADDDSLDGMSALTIEAWLKQPTHHNNGIVNKAGPESSYSYLLQGWGNPYEGLYFAVNGGASRAVASAPPLDEWYHVVGVFTGTALLIFVNGVQTAFSSKATTVPVDSYPVQIGQNGLEECFNGFIDEVRISKTARSVDWISTSYNNQRSPSTFYEVGSEETPPEEIVVSNETPPDGATNVPLNPTLKAHFANYEGLMNTTFSTNATGPWQTIGSYTNVETGYYNVSTTGMDQHETQYWWRAEAEDREHAKSTTKTYSFETKPVNVAPIVSNPTPANQSTPVPTSTSHLSFHLTDLEGDPMNYSVTSSPNIGSGSGTNVADGSYSVSVSGLLYSTTYTWTVNATDGKETTLAVYTFTTQPIQTSVEKIGDYGCMGLGYIGTAGDKDTVYAVWQGPLEAPSGLAVWFAKFDKTQGWIVTNQSVFAAPWGERHPFYEYWDDSYHVGWWDGAAARMTLADNSTFEGFQQVNGADAQYYLEGSLPGNTVPSTYAFSNEYAWVIGSDTSPGTETIAYWAWTKDAGWGSKTLIPTTASATRNSNFPALLPVNETAWYMYYTAYGSSGPQLFYVKSSDQGQTWGPEHTSSIASQVSSNSRPSFARYGDNFYIFLIDTAGDVVIYNSTDGVTWANKQVLYNPSSYFCAQGYAVDQETLVWTASDTYQWGRSDRGHYGVGDQYGGVYLIPEMRADPSSPTLVGPLNGETLTSGTTTTQLQVTAHGAQTYDVAFYWANGTFVGEDKLLTEGGTATVTVSGLSDGRTYEWYAIARGATYGYWGGEPASTSDEQTSDAWTFQVQAKEEPYVTDESPQNESAGVDFNPALMVTIADCQGDVMNVTFSTNTTGTWEAIYTYINVGNGTYSTNTANMNKTVTKYFWRVNVTDGTHWSNVTYSFTTRHESGPWWSNEWLFRKLIIIDHTKVNSSLTNFPVLIDTTDQDLSAHAQGDGDDIAFSDFSGSKLDHEIEQYDSATGELVAWVNVPSLSSVNDTMIYMYYGNDVASNQQNTEGVWDSSYLTVLHLAETSGTHRDSTKYANDGTAHSGLTQGASSKINGGDYFNGAEDYVTVLDDDFELGGMSQLTIEVWAKQPTYHANGLVGKDGNDGYLLQGWSDQQMYFAVGGTEDRAIAPVGSYPLNQWYHLVGVFNGTNILIFINGVLKNETGKTATVPLSSSPVYVGTNNVGSYFTGFLDEVRISNMSRSASWIVTEFNNQHDPSTFYILEYEEQGVPPERPVLSRESPMDGSVGLDPNPTLSITALDYQGDVMNVTFSTNTTGTWEAIYTYINVGNGTYSVNTTTMSNYEAQYWWKVYAIDAKANSTERVYTFFTRPENYLPMVSDPTPAHGTAGVSIDIAMLSFRLTDLDGDYMDYAVTTSPDIGSATATHVDDGVYYVYISKPAYSTEYTWTVSVDDGKSSLTVNYTFITEAGPPTLIGAYYCAGLGYIGGPDAEGNFYVVWQQLTNCHMRNCTDPAGACTLYWARYNATSEDWDVVDQIVTSNYEAWGTHPAWGYWDSQYHLIWDVWGVKIEETMGSSTWDGFASMSYRVDGETIDGYNGEDAVATSYSFDDEHAWVFVTQVVDGKWAITYVPWSKESGWSAPVRVNSTEKSSRVDCGSLLTVDRNKWILYYTTYPSGYLPLRYVISTDQGQTWGPEHTSNIASELGINIRPTFARYGDTFYIFLVSNGGDIVVYKSNDGETWENRQVVYSPSSWQWPTGVLLDQKHLIWTGADLYKWYSWGSGTGDQVGGVFPIPEIRADPETPVNLYPANGMTFDSGTTSVQLRVMVSGSQTYDVAFYWADGTYIGIDRLLKNGDTATITVPVSDETVYEWYAVARGATHSYWGPPASTTDEQKSDTWRFCVGIGEEPYIVDRYPEDRASGIALNPTLSAHVIDFQGDPMNITFSTNATGIWQTIGGYTNVESGIYSVTPTSMDRHGWTYHWRIIAIESTPGTSNATIETYSFTTLHKQTLNPFEEGWPHRKKITFDHTKISADLTDFPVLIDLTDSDLKSKAQADGDDILFMSSIGTAQRLSHEIEYYDGSTGHLIAWVKVPHLSSSVNTAVYMYYGNPHAGSQQDIHGTWDSAYEMVQHFDETSGVLYDSTSHHRDGLTYNGVVQDIEGRIDGADSYDGADDYAKFPSVDLTNQITVEIWTKTKQQAYWQTAFAKGSANAESWYCAWNTAGSNAYKIQWWVTDSSNNRRDMYGTTTLTESFVWHYLVLTYDGATQTGYVDGIEEIHIDWTGTIKSSTEETFVGRNLIWGEPLNGPADEFRISSVARSSAWISTCHNNQRYPSTFMSIGTEETAEAPLISNPSPINGATNTPRTLSQLSFDLLDYQGDLMNYTLTTYPNIGRGNETNVIDGTFSVDVSGLTYSTTYTWNVSATDGNLWTNKTYIFTTESAFDLTVTALDVKDGACRIYANDTYANGTAYEIPVEITIYNNGTEATGPFYAKLELYWINGSESESSAESLVMSVAANMTVVIRFAHLFHPMHTGCYELVATADSRNNVTEGSEANNVLVQTSISVTVMGDINNDGIVNLFDAITTSLAWGTTPTDEYWDSDADLNHDEQIDILDAARVTAHWGMAS